MHGRHQMPNIIAASSPTLPTAHSTPPPRSSTNLECPRCNSLNTKFCYFNNYSQSQPRHFCRSCRRYWTKGGILRNVPIGGGCRKPSKRRLPSSSSIFHGKLNTNIPYLDDNPQPSSATWTVAEEVESTRAVVNGTTNFRPPVFGYSSFELSAPPPTTTNELVRLPEECPRLAFVDPTGWPNVLDVVGGDDGVFHGGGFWTEGGSSIFLS